MNACPYQICKIEFKPSVISYHKTKIVHLKFFIPHKEFINARIAVSDVVLFLFLFILLVPTVDVLLPDAQHAVEKL